MVVVPDQDIDQKISALIEVMRDTAEYYELSRELRRKILWLNSGNPNPGQDRQGLLSMFLHPDFIPSAPTVRPQMPAVPVSDFGCRVSRVTSHFDVPGPE